MDKYGIYIFIQLLATFNSGHCLTIPGNQRNIASSLMSNGTAGIFGATQSEATASGSGSSVGVNGIVTGNVSSEGETQTTGNSTASLVSFQENCSEYSNSFAEGSTTADALSLGNCTNNSDNPSVHGSTVERYENSVTGQASSGSNYSSGQEKNDNLYSEIGSHAQTQELSVTQTSSQNLEEDQIIA